MVFPVFVAEGVGGCCILGNDFNLKYGTTIDFARRKAQFILPNGSILTADFYSEEKEAKYLRPPPDLSWLRNIQIGETVEKRAQVVCKCLAELPPRSQIILKIKYEGTLPDMGIMEPRGEVFREKTVLVPCALTPRLPEEVLVMNLANDKKIYIRWTRPGRCF